MKLTRLLSPLLLVFVVSTSRAYAYDAFESFVPDNHAIIIKTPTDGGIRTEVSGKFKDRFEKWKAELLSTDFGRQQWDTYANNKQFILTIVVTGDKKKGAGTDKFLPEPRTRLDP